MPAKKSKHKHINLLPKEDFDRTTLGRILKWALTTFRFIVIFVEFIVIAGFLSRFWLDVQIGDLDEEIRQKSALISARFPFEVQFRTAQAKIATLQTIGDDENSTLPLLEAISNTIPFDARLTTMTKEGPRLRIQGESETDTSINAFLGNLRSLPQLTDVSLIRLEKDSDVIFTEFTIEAIINFSELES